MKLLAVVRPIVAAALAVSLTLQPVHAVYNANMTGVVVDVLTYTEGTQIYFRLDNQPASHPACNAVYFSIDQAVPSENRKALLARLLLAMANGNPTNVGFDNSGNCSHGYIRAHRVG
jgi:hypothetical protein